MFNQIRSYYYDRISWLSIKGYDNLRIGERLIYHVIPPIDYTLLTLKHSQYQRRQPLVLFCMFTYKNKESSQLQCMRIVINKYLYSENIESKAM